jgi:ribosomal protein S25
MPRNVPIKPEKEQEIIAALEKDSHASRVARTLGDVSYATVWRVADRNAIALKAGRETMGRPRLPAEVWARIAREVGANPSATQKELARRIGVSRSTVGRVMRAPQDVVPLLS